MGRPTGRLTRRSVICALVAGVLAPRPITAQSRLPRVALVTGSSRSHRAILSGLQELGYTPGKNIDVRAAATEGRFERYRPAVENALGDGPDVLLVSSPHALNVAVSLTRTLPIVAVDLETDPVASGLAASLARPGGNVSGLFLDVPELSAKMLEVLREAVPGAGRIAVLWDAAIAGVQFEATDRAAKVIGITVHSVAVRQISEVEPALAGAVTAGARALVVLSSPQFRVNQARLDDFALRHRLPSVTMFDLLPTGQGFLSYGPDVDDMFRRSASYIDRVLKGARIGELPVERPSRFILGVNRRTARALRLTVPPSLLLRADLVVD